MNINEFNSRVRSEVNILKQNYRDDNSAFLIWFLKNIFCLEEQTSVDSVCDGSNDKGIDGIWIDNESEDLYIFQSKFSPNDNRDEGDSEIKEFVGVRPWFSSKEKVNGLLGSLANNELKNLIRSLKIEEKIENEYSVILVYVTNKIFDQNAKEYLETCSNMEFYDNNSLFGKYTYIVEEEVENNPKVLSVPNTTAIVYDDVESIKSIVLPVQAKELLKLDGIQDRTLFSRNVRYWVGRTRVNKGIENTLKDNSEHLKFFLYHNGVTIICNTYRFDKDKKQIKLEGYQVINGCQSILSFYENRSNLTDNIYILVKIIKTQPHSPIIQKITHNTNNQNAISLKDLKSNDRIQIGLQKKFKEFFNDEVLYKIKKGESVDDYKEVIDIDFAAQLLLAFYFKQPYNTHLKTKIFSDEYEKLFSRKTTCQKIYLANLIFKIINENTDKLSNLQIRGYGLSKFAILRFFRDILEADDLGKGIIEYPDDYIHGNNLEILKKSIEKLFELISLDINAFIKEYIEENEFFDYKNLFKNSHFVDKMSIEIIRVHEKDMIRHPEDSFKKIFENINNSE